ncbi:DUF2510 domain-containing protein [Janibacter sp. GS2]|uniref:DUF2510 domain-containing protein n=1 Tax=Janibacter sp. GS2 TaxID=3442646 RepID=UPI003EBA949D
MNEHAPGWYEHDGERRYWDGSQWTHSTSLPPPSSVARVPQSGELAPYAPPPVYGAPALPRARKEPALSLLLSFFIPGVGSMVNGDVGAGVAFLLVYGLGLVLLVCLGWLIVGLIGLPICVGAWAWSMYHAYLGAVNFNRSVGYAG